LPSSPFLLDQALKVGRRFELLAAIPAASVGRDDLVTFGDANGFEIRQDDERAARAIVRDGVVVEVEAGVGRLADFDLDAFEHGERLIGQRKQPGFLLTRGVAHGARRLS
jgi:hypothetical protein